MSDVPSGRDLVHQLWVAAGAKGMTLSAFVAPLTGQPNKFLQQLREARRPKPATIERVRALIEGREIPPAANQPKVDYSTCTRAERERRGLDPSSRQLCEERSLTAAELEKERVAWRRALAEAATVERRPGETLHAAVRRLETELRAA
jgi:hypothetical protein